MFLSTHAFVQFTRKTKQKINFNVHIILYTIVLPSGKNIFEFSSYAKVMPCIYALIIFLNIFRNQTY